MDPRTVFRRGGCRNYLAGKDALRDAGGSLPGAPGVSDTSDTSNQEGSDTSDTSELAGGEADAADDRTSANAAVDRPTCCLFAQAQNLILNAFERRRDVGGGLGVEVLALELIGVEVGF